MTPELYERIRKLLALATQNNNQAEAQAALLKVQVLMAEMAEDAPFLDLGASLDSQIQERLVARDDSVWWKRILRVISENFRVFAYLKTEEGATYLVGHADDLEVAVAVALAARHAAQALAMAWWGEHSDEPLSVQEEFLHGFGAGLDSQFKDQVVARGFQPLLKLSPALDAYIKSLGLVPGDPVPAPPVEAGAYGGGWQAGYNHQRLAPGER